MWGSKVRGARDHGKNVWSTKASHLLKRNKLFKADQALMFLLPECLQIFTEWLFEIHPSKVAPCRFRSNYILLQNKRWAWCGAFRYPHPLPTPKILEGRNWPLQIIYHWKGNLIPSKVLFKYWKNILISQLYEQLCEMLRRSSAMALEKNSKLLKYEYIIYIALKHVIRRFRICN